ncbi:Neprosin [Arabidopsis suecica]|uniref:Neprosin n=2 Tax=Arabidopsis TaxID=3701 RepID=A0A8T2G4D6_ARASU|nr:Neprosin [Arabidopsis suecica]
MVEGNVGSILQEFDCVDIYKQPAFQHPLLKNHKIQENFNFNKSHIIKNKYKENVLSCPQGTVPVLKQKNGTESIHLNTVEYPGQHFATIETVLDGSIYRGAESMISIHNVTVQNNQYSKSQIWLENGPRGELNSIQFGWAVHPRLYGDTLTRLTIYWTADGYKKTGCYNTNCPGFVIISRVPQIGIAFNESSIYGGKGSVVIRPQLFQDGFSGNWVLKDTVMNEIVGYWPKELFTHLNKGASLVRFGGNTFTSPDGISPPMGNGHFPVISYFKSSHYVHVKVKNSNYQLVDIESRKARIYADSYQCYRLSYWGYFKSTGVSFSFGGPGGKCGI